MGADALQVLGAGSTEVVYEAASGEPTILAAQQLIGQEQAVRGYTLFSEVSKFAAYAGELIGYLQTGKLQLPVQTEVVELGRRELGDVSKLLLMKVIRLLIADARVATPVVIVVKIIRDAGLRVR